MSDPKLTPEEEKAFDERFGTPPNTDAFLIEQATKEGEGGLICSMCGHPANPHTVFGEIKTFIAKVKEDAVEAERERIIHTITAMTDDIAYEDSLHGLTVLRQELEAINKGRP